MSAYGKDQEEVTDGFMVLVSTRMQVFVEIHKED
jgi:hypothetical protein